MPDASPREIISLLHRHRFDLSTEKAAQAGIETALRDQEIAFTREPRLSPRDIPDFLIDESGLAIEVKIKGAKKMDVFRQLQRYAEHDQVKSLLLVTNLAMGLPAEIGGKPAYYASLGRAWL